MPCACTTCRHHATILGLAKKSLTKTEIHKAFRAEAKLWHPDRFENNPAQRAEAEEHFKLIQVAYRELWEHCENPAQNSSEEIPADPVAPTAVPADQTTYQGTVTAPEETPPPFFGGAPNCFVAPHFPQSAGPIILAGHMEATERPLAIVDLSGYRSGPPQFSQYVFLTSYRIFVRNALNIVTFLWYSDVGDTRFIDLYRHGKPRFWVAIVDQLLRLDPKYSLEIYRRNGTFFHSIAGEADDSVKKVIYNFLLQKKSQAHS
jgi:DnaJ-like protein